MNKWIWVLISMLLTNMSTPLRELLESCVKQMEAKAKETATPADDLFVNILKWALGMP